MLGDRGDEALISRLVEHAAGNAFYLEELIRAVAERRDAGAKDAAPLPGTVLAMVQTRLETLEPDARRVLRAASIFGETFSLAGVRALLGEEMDATGDAPTWLRVLTERELVTYRGRGTEAAAPPRRTTPRTRSTESPDSMLPQLLCEPEYAFRHALLREGAYAMLTPADRALGHRIAGQWLRDAGERDASVLADHFERGGNRAGAAELYARAAEQALEANDVDAAAARAQRGVACGASGALLGRLRLAEAEARQWGGRLEEAAERALEALALLPRGTTHWCAAGERVVYVHGQLGRYDDVNRFTDTLLEVVPESAALGRYLMALARASWFTGHAGQHARSDELLRRVESLASGLSREDVALEGELESIRAGTALYRGDPEACIAFSERAWHKFMGAGDLRSAFMQRVYWGDAYKELGAYEQARELLLEAAEGARALGNQMTAVLADFNLAMTLARLGDLGAARALEERALEGFVAQGQRRLASAAREYLAHILLLSGELDLAATHAERGLSEPPRAPAIVATASGVLANVELRRGRPDAALAAAKEGYAIVLALGEHMGEGEAMIRLAYAEAIHATEGAPAACEVIEVAKARLLQRAARIRDGALRESFLGRVPENARTLVLADAWVAAKARSSNAG